ncbi:MAG TPA: Calx-beta domain-containing protein [Thermoanaerobaculia bacterium]
MAHRFTLSALTLAFGAFLLASGAWAQHHDHSMMGVNPKDYDDGGGRGGDPNPPSGCSGIQAKITIAGESFSPSTVTVQAGQPVCWTWAQSIAHNVHADDDSFTSGAPSNTGNFQITFNTPGTYGFYCQVHGSTTGGMRGTIVVQGSTDGGGGDQSGPGTIALDPSSYTVNMSDGVVTVTVDRAGGSDGKASVRYTTAPGTAKSGKDFTPRKGVLNWADGDGDPKTIQIPVKKAATPQPDKTFSVKLSKPTGAPLGTATAAVTIHDDRSQGCNTVASEVRAEVVDEGSTAACDETRALCLGGGRFEATVQWQPSISRADRGSRRVAVSEASDTGLFASSPEEEPQILLHVLDRCAVNGHYWVDFAAVTDLEFTIRVRDTQTGRTRIYHHPAGSAPAPVRDVEAFASCL